MTFVFFFHQKSKTAYGSSHARTNSATRYVQTTQKPTLTKSQSVEEIRKKAQVSKCFALLHHDVVGRQNCFNQIQYSKCFFCTGDGRRKEEKTRR